GQCLVRARSQAHLGHDEGSQGGGDDPGNGQHHGGDAKGGLGVAPDGCERAIEDLADRDRPQRDDAGLGGLRGRRRPPARLSAIAGAGLAVPRLAIGGSRHLAVSLLAVSLLAVPGLAVSLLAVSLLAVSLLAVSLLAVPRLA